MDNSKISQDTNSLTDVVISVIPINSKNFISDDFSKIRICCFSYKKNIYFVDNFKDFFVKLHSLLIKQFPSIFKKNLDKKIFWSFPKNKTKSVLLPNGKWIVMPSNPLDALYYIKELEQVFNYPILTNLSLYKLVTSEKVFVSNSITLGTSGNSPDNINNKAIKLSANKNKHKNVKYAELPETTVLSVESYTAEVQSNISVQPVPTQP